MGHDMAIPIVRYPYFVTMSDEILSLSEIDRYAAEAIRMNTKMETLRILNAVAGLGAALSIIVSILAVIGAGISNDEHRLESIYQLSIALIIFFVLMGIRVKINISMSAIGLIKRNELMRIDSDPESCEKLANWISEYDHIKLYVENIYSKGRLPTFAEFHCVERWVTQKQNERPLEHLKRILNVANSI